MESGITRREFVAAAAPVAFAAGAGTALPLFALGCGPTDDAELDRRLVASLRSLVGGRTGSGTLTADASLDAAEALALLRDDLSPRRLLALTWSDWLLRDFVEERRRRDFREGRVRAVAGWLLAETEVAIAVLLGF